MKPFLPFMAHPVWGGLVMLLMVGSIGCAAGGQLQHEAPDELLGTFVDDYDISYVITADLWVQQPQTKYHITAWHPEAHYLIAHNDTTNPGDGGLWTRIDWIRLDDMPPYTWAFCLSTYDAVSAEAAEKVTTAQKEAPRTGCNGFPVFAYAAEIINTVMSCDTRPSFGV